MADAELRMYRGRPTLFIDGKPIRLPEPARVEDLTGCLHTKTPTDCIDFALESPETRLFRLY